MRRPCGLRTEARLMVDAIGPWGTTITQTNMANIAFMLSHTALPDSTNYFYLVEGAGAVGFTNQWFPMVYDSGLTTQAWSTMYAIGFDTRATNRVPFLDQIQFRGEPLPPDYLGKSPNEWN